MQEKKVQLTDIPIITKDQTTWHLFADALFPTKTPSIDDLLRALKENEFWNHQYIYASFCNRISAQYRKIKKEFTEIDIHTLAKNGFFDFYLCKDTRIQYPLKYPALYIGGDLYMSISPMEVQSHINHYLWSEGNVLIGGLGLGFIVNQLLLKPSVKSIDVIENEQEVIDLYLEVFGKNPKVNLIHEDFFKYTSPKYYTYIYADIWSGSNYERILRESETLLKRKEEGSLNFEKFSFWTVEEAIWTELYEKSEHFISLLMKYHCYWGIKEIQALYSLIKGI